TSRSLRPNAPDATCGSAKPDSERALSEFRESSRASRAAGPAANLRIRLSYRSALRIDSTSEVDLVLSVPNRLNSQNANRFRPIPFQAQACVPAYQNRQAVQRNEPDELPLRS